MKKWKWSVLFVMALCIERGISQVNKLHLGRDLSRVSDFVLFVQREPAPFVKFLVIFAEIDFFL